MKKRNQVRRNGSPAAAAPQSKTPGHATPQGRAGHQSTANGNFPSCFCLFDGEVGEMVCEMPRVKTLLHEVVVAAFQRSLSADQFIADAISEKLARTVTCVWTGPDGSEFARVDFTREIFACIEHVASEMHVSLQQFFDNAIQDFIHSRENRRAA